MEKQDETVVEETTTEETAPEDDTSESTSEEETEETSTEEESEESEDDSIDWKERAMKAERAIEKAKKKDKKKDKSEDTNDDVTITRLEVRGVMEPEDQEYVLRFAKAEGISPIEALTDDIVKDRLEANKRKRNSVSATPRGNNRAATQENEVDSWVRKYKRTGELPDNNPALTSKILDKLKDGA